MSVLLIFCHDILDFPAGFQIHPEILQPEVFFLSQFASDQKLHGDRISGQLIGSPILVFHVYTANGLDMIQHFPLITAADKIFSIYLLFFMSNSFSDCNNIRMFFSYQWNPLLFQYFLKCFDSVVINVEIARL